MGRADVRRQNCISASNIDAVIASGSEAIQTRAPGTVRWFLERNSGASFVVVGAPDCFAPLAMTAPALEPDDDHSSLQMVGFPPEAAFVAAKIAWESPSRRGAHFSCPVTFDNGRGCSIVVAMLTSLRISEWRSGVAACFAVAMLLLGFAHSHARVDIGPGTGGPAISLGALPDGSVPELCGNRSGAPGRSHGAANCDACQLVAAPGAIPLPPVAILNAAAPQKLPLVLALVATAVAPAPIAQSRGPPVL